MGKAKNRWKKLGAFLLAVVLTFAIVPVSQARASYQDDIADLNDQIDELKKQQEQLQNEIAATQDEKEETMEKKAQLDKQVQLTKEEIALLEERIALLEQSISDKEDAIAEKEKEIEDSYELFKQRLRAMYMAGDSSIVGMLLGAQDFADFLTSAEMVSRISEHDRDLIEYLMQAKADIEEDKADLEEDKASVEADRDELDAAKQLLDGQVQQASKEIYSLELLEKEMSEKYDQIKADMDAAQAEIDRIYAENESTGDYVGGEFLWPLPGYTYISSGFGWRFGGTDYHTGIDITGGNVFQKEIKAANSGTVIVANTTYTPGKGYGQYVIIDHGGGYSTLYAHMYALYVSTGDYVERGEAIGQVGSTGWSTGPHLHFEIRVDGKAQDPMNWF